MKYLLFALFIGTAYGQDTTDVPESMSGYKLARVVFDTTWWYNLPKAKTQEQRLAEHWENYKKSLDSVYLFKVNDRINKCLSNRRGFEVIFFDGGITVKEKLWYYNFDRGSATLDGFMKYLKELK